MRRKFDVSVQVTNLAQDYLADRYGLRKQDARRFNSDDIITGLYALYNMSDRYAMSMLRSYKRALQIEALSK